VTLLQRSQFIVMPVAICPIFATLALLPVHEIARRREGKLFGNGEALVMWPGFLFCWKHRTSDRLPAAVYFPHGAYGPREMRPKGSGPFLTSHCVGLWCCSVTGSSGNHMGGELSPLGPCQGRPSAKLRQCLVAPFLHFCYALCDGRKS
jgi:hypothetical protein